MLCPHLTTQSSLDQTRWQPQTTRWHSLSVFLLLVDMWTNLSTSSKQKNQVWSCSFCWFIITCFNMLQVSSYNVSTYRSTTACTNNTWNRGRTCWVLVNDYSKKCKEQFGSLQNWLCLELSCPILQQNNFQSDHHQFWVQYLHHTSENKFTATSYPKHIGFTWVYLRGTNQNGNTDFLVPWFWMEHPRLYIVKVISNLPCTFNLLVHLPHSLLLKKTTYVYSSCFLILYLYHIFYH